MSTPEPGKPDPAEFDPIYRAIGRFMVEFSQVVEHMRAALHALSMGHATNDMQRAWRAALAVVPSTATMIDMFFAVHTILVPVSDDEKHIRDLIYQDVKRLNSQRNRIAHAGWYGLAAVRGTLGQEGVKIQDEEFPVAKLESLADQADEVRRVVWALYSGSHGPADWPRIGDRLGVEDGRVVRKDLTDWKPPQAAD